MSEQTKNCPHCGTENDAKVRFCIECGKPMVPAAAEKPAAAPVSKRGFQKGTMIAFQSPFQKEDPVAEKAAASGAAQGSSSQPLDKTLARSSGEFAGQAASQTRPRSVGDAQAPFAGKTMLGISGQFTDSGTATPAKGEDRAAPPADQLESTVQAPAGALPDADQKPPAAGRPIGGKTMLGIGADTAAGQFQPPRQQEAKPTPGTATGQPAAAAPAAASDARAAAASPGGRTMLGVPLPTVPDKATEPEKPAAPSAAAGADSGRTMLGVGVAQEPAAVAGPAQADAITQDEEEAYRPAVRPAGGGKAAAIAAVVGLIAIAVAGGVFWFGKTRQPAIKATVITVEDSDALRFEVPGAPPGTKLRFGGQEKVLQAGRAEFRLADDALRVGDNVAPVDVVRPDGTVKSAKIPLRVPYLIRVDTSPLHADEPAVDVIVNALPGSRVSLDGQPLELDQQGRGVRRYPIDAASAPASGTIEQVVRYRVHPPSGADAVDELHTTISVSTMQIDRPGLEAVTDKESVEVNGAVAPDSEVTVDGNQVPVKSGRFLYRLALPELGEYTPKVIAREPGKAPHARTIKIRRVADLKKEADSFQADSSLTYARIAQNPSLYQGQKVAFEGRVYNVSVQGGQSVIQMLVRDCPKGSRCSLWVTYPADTDATNNSWVRILGTIQGQQQFRSENERIVTVPKVAAAFVLLLSR